MLETDIHEQPVAPPPPPAIRRRFVVAGGQLAGLGLLLAVPVLASLGVFGATDETVSARLGNLEVTVVHPGRTRYMTTQALDVAVANTGREAVAAVDVGIDRTYVAAFSDARFVPDVRRVDAEDYRVDLGELPPGATRHLRVWLQADAYGRHTGAVSISADGRRLAPLPIATLILP